MCSPSLISSINTGYAVPVALAAGNPGTVTVEDDDNGETITISPSGGNSAIVTAGGFPITRANKVAVFDAINRALDYKAT